MSDQIFSIHLPVNDLAEVLGITPQAIHKYMRDKGLRSKENDSPSKLLPEEVDRFITHRHLDKPKAIISTHLVKGGVGKTTICHALASRSAAYGFKTLMIDLDQQANLSTSFNTFADHNTDPTLIDIFEGHIKGKKVIVNDAIKKLNPYLHIIPSNLTMTNFDNAIVQKKTNIKKVLGNILNPIVDNYDLIFIDCPPALNYVTTAAHCFSDLVLLPINADKFSMDGLGLTFGQMITLNKQFDVSPDIKIVLNKFDAREKLPIQIMGQISNSEYKDLLCDTYISNSKQIQNSIAQRECVWYTKSKSPALENLNNLLIEILEIGDWKEVLANNNAIKRTANVNQGTKEDLING